jgi:protein-S-isoprenylcysteine O-methyltransferase Ste14
MVAAMNVLFLQALLAFLALPGMVAYVVPILIAEPGRGVAFDARGVGLLIAGTALLLWCVREFYVAGKGTLAPWTPPRHLVVSGLYRYSRNPMYVAVVIVLLGWALAFHSRPLAIYTLAVAISFHLRIVLGEEPWLARTHGDAWLRYAARVPRWIGRARG